MKILETIQNKILSAHNISTLVREWKQQGKKIVFTNGCFDILHYGHVFYLARAAEEGDILIVGVNSDISVRNIKGKDRPLTKETARFFQVASLQMVSAVVPFDDNTPFNLIDLIRPDVLVKGADYKPENIVGYDIVMQNGGKVVTVEIAEGFSTTGILDLLKKI
ncbi:MAG: D-glycero-beta-D-manno-heptose 1-phosphate adenylyltransferase [Bacteroidetes bacterium]|nr:D-glycero-beta-D-manno-heptose 1-phosphate adenylyltransferase [Bacteroidota bacterium]MBU1717605.1 D-glycero-beta-D-manno-heptose 1-phosphate adenylyltransferase [Bacteroidota bacterium]